MSSLSPFVSQEPTYSSLLKKCENKGGDVDALRTSVAQTHMHPDVQGFFGDFRSAACFLRTLHELNAIIIPPPGSDATDEIPVQLLEVFFATLREVEHELHLGTTTGKRDFYVPIFFVVEGLDGSGKSTLVVGFRGGDVHVTATPPASLADVRGIFDAAGGAIARAFYMVSNYICYAEMVAMCREREEDLVFVVDRFFSSTFGYTIGEKAEGIVSLWQNSDTLKSCLRGRQGLAGDLPHADLLRWPADLPRPAGILFLSLDPAARVERIKRREESSTQVERERIVNDWDVKTKDPALAARIAYCMELLATANAVPFHSLDATVTAVEVLRKGSEIVTGGPRGGEKS